ncbi:5'/3'-nucleotidase SurE, partial [Candidatus Bathyarchaeota archaeon]|nr:5'/3'-nucleotidase SurE [Candidatus Bathyarchaeota archaeon]NIV44191.1 5'/3'-nucleotidase SurE [Candidatus Bathyarchaeota archaeon]NIW10512.1 5'/3'-nucleotidase SurE [Gammaproteobacteria bacterium]
MKTILLVNDDGIESIGLFMLKEKLEELGEVVVVTPRNERSGIGKAITSSEYVQVVETRLKDGSAAYAISGTP